MEGCRGEAGPSVAHFFLPFFPVFFFNFFQSFPLLAVPVAQGLLRRGEWKKQDRYKEEESEVSESKQRGS